MPFHDELETILTSLFVQRRARELVEMLDEKNTCPCFLDKARDPIGALYTFLKEDMDNDNHHRAHRVLKQLYHVCILEVDRQLSLVLEDVNIPTETKRELGNALQRIAEAKVLQETKT